MTQPDALRLALDLEGFAHELSAAHYHPDELIAAAAELRRLHDLVEQQRRTIDALMCGMPDDETLPTIKRIGAMESQNAELLAALREVTRLAESVYALEGKHGEIVHPTVAQARAIIQAHT
jgi:hypothetical protein